MQSSLKLRQGDKALDAGCGEGLSAIVLLNEYYKKRGIDITVHAFDISSQMLRLTSKNASRHNLTEQLILYHADGEDLSEIETLGGIQTAFKDSSFDLVMSSGMLEYVAKPEIAIDEMVRVLKPGGQLLFSFAKDNPLGRLLSRLWNFRILSEEYLREQFQLKGIQDLKEFQVNSHNFYMKYLKSICIGRKC
jgi:ubiquinone/menaquinone biosynthesis C-methylase UbiE